MNNKHTINIGKDFSRYPVGRYLIHGDSNGEKFREEFLRPALARGGQLSIKFDDALGYGSSFLEEAFGGLIRHGFMKAELISRLELVTSDESLRTEVLGYINEASGSNE